MHEHFAAVRQILGQIKFGTLATASADGQPWNSPLVMPHDAELNFYWFSDRESTHGRNVRANPRVFIVFYDSTVSVGQGDVDRALYLEAQAHEIDDPAAAERACQLCTVQTGIRLRSASFLPPEPRRVYQATVQRAWVNDVERQGGKFVRDFRVELALGELKQYLARA